MCIVIDINCLVPVFVEACKKHKEFGAVKSWIEEGNGFLVYGGSRYRSELHRAFRFLRLIRQMRDGGKAFSIRDSVVDELEAIVKLKTQGTHCDDQHVIALLGAAKCTLLCSEDTRSFPFVKNRSLYPNGMPKVKIYSSKRNIDLLTKCDWRALTNVE